MRRFTAEQRLPAPSSKSDGDLKYALYDVFRDLGTSLDEVQAQVTRLAKQNGGQAVSVADGGTIPHGLPAAPTVVILTGTNAAQFVTIAGVSASNITVAIKTAAGAGGAAENIWWYAKV